ncbi:ribosome maturation factor RimM [Roseivirga pacifica]|uniref:ribosome maturation factor RimM n=1 Tax=Roseivirga pacifica TaxID=1267423 RepID=UPI003BABF553
MTVDECYLLGYIIKAHGLKGEVQVAIDADSPEAYQDLESVFVQQGQQLVPFFIESMSLKGNRAIVALEEVLTVEEANALKGAKLYLPLAVLPELPDDEFYLHELAGYSVIDAATSQTVGKVVNLIESGPQLILVLENEDDQEILLPYQEELLVALNKSATSISLKIPEGLLDIYTSEDEN